MTLTDEGTIEGGVPKRRQQKIYSDVFGRTAKTEVFNWQGGSVYSATVNTYNPRDQITQVRQYTGAEGSGTYQDTTMGYDGYGRLKSKHVPQQDAGTATTWDYFSDDTIQKVTDARGASATYAYNGRHQVTGITYAAPSGITPTPNVSFGYDAAGNRTSMTDGLGSATYNYSVLSRMTSETRTFNGLAGSYTLSYGYNLAGQLTSLTEPSQFGSTVSYVHDSAGRLTDVTGSGFGATTQFATGIQYRAWGAAKHVSYGSGAQLNVTYNARLLPTRYELGNVMPLGPPPTIMGSENQYFADGRIRYAQDLQNGTFDRAYEYDHAARLKEAYSGREARGLPPLPNYRDPLRQTFVYDAWNNMGQTGSHWSGARVDLPTYTNNRRPDWSYDAAGNVTLRNYERKQHTYNAAGQEGHFREQEWGLPQYAYEENTIDITYDGNGQPAKRFENRHTENYEGGLWDEPKTTYYVRSTVLGGEAVIEIVPVEYGSKQNIYMGGQKIAERLPDSGWMGWRHVNPVTGSWLTSFNGGGAYRNELDPLGSEVGTGDPYVSYTSYSDIMGPVSLYEERGNPFDPGGGCGTVDGLPISCSEKRQRMLGGSIADEVTFGGSSGYIPIRDDGVGILQTWKPNPEPLRVNSSLQIVLRDSVNPWGLFARLFGHNELVSFPFEQPPTTGEPQNTSLPSDLRDRVQARLNNPNSNCADFTRRLIDEAARISKEPAFSNDAMKNFDRIGLSNFILKNVGDKGQANFEGSKRVVHITPVPLGNSAASINHTQNAYAATALNEVIHHSAKSGIYSDRIMARATFNILPKEQQAKHPLPETSKQKVNSGYWHPLYLENCHGR